MKFLRTRGKFIDAKSYKFKFFYWKIKKEIPAGRNSRDSIAQLLFNYVIGYKFPTIMRGIALRTV